MRLVLIAALLLSTAPVFAVDAVTYTGTLGGYPIVAELTDPQSGPVVGRYSYLSKGGDIPLNAIEGPSGAIALAEEAPCTEQTCPQGEAGTVANAPVGASWSLQYAAADQTLIGHWQAIGQSAKSLPIVLTEIARRTLPEDAELSPAGLYDSGFYADDSTPYDDAKMAVPLQEGSVAIIDGSSVRDVTDPRSKFAFPRIVALADGASPDVANATLARRHATLNGYAFDCLAQIYAGFGGNEYSAGMGAGTLGDYDSESITISYLSPTVMNWIESGSTYCTGAYPDNHANSFIIDVRTGQPLPLARVFKDWIAASNINDYAAAVDQAEALNAPQDYVWQAGRPLIDYVIANRIPSDDAALEAECAINDLIATNLGVRFASGDKVVFTLQDLPHVIFACGDDLLTVPLADIPQFLTPQAADYFPALAH